MLFSRSRFQGADAARARDTLRSLWPTTAEPVDFAVPVDVVEDDEGYTLRFDMHGHAEGDIHVRADESSLVIESGGCRRTFWLAAGIDADRVETEFDDVELKVRLIKARVAAARKIVVRRGP